MSAVKMPRRSLWVARYLAAAAIMAAAVGVRLLPWVPLHGLYFLTIFPAVVLATFVGGRGPGLLAVALGILGSWYFIIPPVASFAIGSASDLLGLITFAPVALMDWAIVAALQKALARERLLRQEADRLARENLELAENRRWLLRELRHRVGNSLQAVATLLDVEAATLGQPDLRAALRGVTLRVRLFLQAQGQLLEADMPDFAGFLRELAEEMSAAAGLRLSFDAAPATLPADTAVPLALIAYELIAAGIEQADGPAQLAIHMAASGGETRLTVSCPGRGVVHTGLAAGRPRRQLLSGLLDQVGGRLVMAPDGCLAADVVLGARPAAAA